MAAHRAGQLAYAKECHEEAKRLRGVLGDVRGTASTLGNLALLCEGPDEAIELYNQSLSLRERLGDTWGVAGSHRAIATQLKLRGNADDEAAARRHLGTALASFRDVGDALGVAECLESLALLRLDAPKRAANLLGAALGVRKARGAAVDAVMQHGEAKKLKDDQAKEWAKGEALGADLAKAVSLGLKEAEVEGDPMQVT